MNRITRLYLFALAAGATLATVATTLAPAPAGAQTFMMPSTPVKGVWIEARHSTFDGFEANLPSSVWFVSGRAPVTPRLSAVLDIPFSHARLSDEEIGTTSNTVLGNPYVGAELAPSGASGPWVLEVGTRLPLNTADEESFADVLAFLADPLNPEAFLEDLIPVTAAATFRHALGGGMGLRARAGVTTLFDTGEDDETGASGSTEAALDYGVVGTYAAGAANIGLGFAGRWYATNDDGSFAETSLHHAALTADMALGRVRPGVSLRVPVDGDYRDVVDTSFGLYLQLPVR